MGVELHHRWPHHFVPRTMKHRHARTPTAVAYGRSSDDRCACQAPGACCVTASTRPAQAAPPDDRWLLGVVLAVLTFWLFADTLERHSRHSGIARARHHGGQPRGLRHGAHVGVVHRRRRRLGRPDRPRHRPPGRHRVVDRRVAPDRHLAKQGGLTGLMIMAGRVVQGLSGVHHALVARGADQRPLRRPRPRTCAVVLVDRFMGRLRLLRLVRRPHGGLLDPRWRSILSVRGEIGEATTLNIRVENVRDRRGKRSCSTGGIGSVPGRCGRSAAGPGLFALMEAVGALIDSAVLWEISAIGVSRYSSAVSGDSVIEGIGVDLGDDVSALALDTAYLASTGDGSALSRNEVEAGRSLGAGCRPRIVGEYSGGPGGTLYGYPLPGRMAAGLGLPYHFGGDFAVHRNWRGPSSRTSSPSRLFGCRVVVLNLMVKLPWRCV